ncbi:MAG: hypothetical protein LBF40_04755 [Deltaproteobacteria bacterium]|jgi:hypothetical protein|nr:hypothetical protein [Deltaproteobacteria bacterium]
MAKRILNAIVLIALFAAPLSELAFPEGGVLTGERRLAAPFPERPRPRQREVKKYFLGVDAFFADRFPLRERLLGLSSALYGAMDASPNSDYCFRGKEDWLFTGNNYGGFVDKFQGILPLDRQGLLRLTDFYLERRDAARKRGADFLVIISPEKISVYSELAPQYIIPGKVRHIAPLLETLSDAGVRVVDPTDRMIALKKPGEAFYYRTDTHWNLLGGYVCFELFRETYGLPPLPSFTMESLPPMRGDLVNVAGYTSFPLHDGDNFEPRWDPPLDVSEDGNDFENPLAPSDKSVWIFADSSNYSIRPYFIAMFREVRIFEHADFERMMSSDLPGPDLIIWMTVERGFG